MSNIPTISATTPLVFHPDDDQTYGANFTSFGLGTRTISSVGSMSATPTGLTFSNEGKNASTATGEYGQTVAIGKQVTFDMTGGTAGTDYVIMIPLTLSDGSTMNGVILAQCRDE